MGRLRRCLQRARTGAVDVPRPPYEYVQLDVERNLHAYLGVAPDKVRLVVVVGAWHGHEVARMLSRYPVCRFVCLEPNPADFTELAERYASEERVVCLQAAAADVVGTLPLLQMTVKGTASLLAPRPDVARLEPAGVVTVRAVRLDDLNELRGQDVDCLWVDVQGAEDRVLAGAAGTLARTRALFLEVATRTSPYVGGVLFDTVDAVAHAAGLRLAALGTDPENGEGNALWVR